MRIKYHYILITFLAVILSTSVWGQRLKVENLPKYDRAKYHFGFTLGVNQMNFAIKTVENYRSFDSLMLIEPLPEWGFNIGIVSDLRMGDHFNLRFVPTLAFGDRNLQYSILERDTLVVTRQKRVESTYIDLPFYVKFKSRRLTNARAYVITGLKYSIDMASQKDKKEESLEYLLKLKRNDFSWEVGTGFDFYLQYFKFGIELKMSYGLRDLLERENNIYTNSIQRLNSKIFWISFTFE